MTPYYDEGGITIYHGDCMDVLPTLRALNGGYALIADPPYGVSYKADESRSVLTRANGYPMIHGDDQPFDPLPFLGANQVILWGANHYADRLPPSPGWLIWDKRAGLPSNDFADCELAWTNFARPARLFSHRWMGMLKDSERGRSYHPNQKPLALMRWCLSMTTGSVIDPFMGSGTTLVAAKEQGRQAIGIEIEERYCEIAVQRLAQGVLDFA